MALGLDPDRALDPERFSVSGALPRVAVRPRDRDELCEALRAASRDGLTVVPWGGGVSLAREAAPVAFDVAIDLTGLDRVIEYEPADLTLTAECGVTLATLGALLAARGQELPIEGARAERATLGGALAANTSAARRVRFGAPRDRILGARFALGDGTLARSGGKVVKNVAGYGIHRLVCGSRGGLTVIVEASLKLLPAPAKRVALIHHLEADRIADAATWSTFGRLEPAALTVLGRDAAARAGADFAPRHAAPGAGFAVVVGLEDDAAWVEAQAEQVTRALGRPEGRLEGDDVITLWRRIADLDDAPGSRLVFTGAHRTPAALGTLLGEPRARELVMHALAGRLHVAVDPPEAPALAARLATLGFTCIDAVGIDRGIEPALPRERAVTGLRERIHAQLDPGGRFALGERWRRGG
jgi:glycolate oxidase FAD binding subunit